MKFWSAILSVALMATLAFSGGNAEAKRMGGGNSVGKQSSNVTQREAGGSATQQARPAAPTTAPAAPKKPWGAMLGGLAAGLGLAWLASSLGLGEGLAQFMTFALLALVVMLVIGFVMRKLKANREGAAQSSSPFAFQGAGATPVLLSPRVLISFFLACSSAQLDESLALLTYLLPPGAAVPGAAAAGVRGVAPGLPAGLCKVPFMAALAVSAAVGSGFLATMVF